MAYIYDPTQLGWTWQDEGSGPPDSAQPYGSIPPANRPGSYYGYGDLSSFGGADPDQAGRQALGPEIADNLARLINPPPAVSPTPDQTTGDPDLDALIYGVRHAGLSGASGAASGAPPDDLAGLSGPELADLIRQTPTSLSDPGGTSTTPPITPISPAGVANAIPSRAAGFTPDNPPLTDVGAPGSGIAPIGGQGPTPADVYSIMANGMPPSGPQANAATPSHMAFAGPGAAGPAGAADILSPDQRNLLNRLSIGEATTDADARKHGFASGYDVPYDFGRYAKSDIPLSKMMLGQVEDFQRQMKENPSNHGRSTPVGKYQITAPTLRGLANQMGLKSTDIFDANLQDRLGKQLLIKRGLEDYMSGKISAQQFQASLATEWASVQYPGENTTRTGQRLGTTTAQIQDAIGKVPLLRGMR